MTAPPIIAETIARPIARDPFSILRGRTIALYMTLSVICTLAMMFVFLIAGFVVYGRSFKFDSPLLLAAIQLLLYGFAVLFGFQLMKRAGLKAAMILGFPLDWTHLRKYWALPLLLVAVSITAYYAFYWPLSFAMPRFIAWYLFQRSAGDHMIATSGTGYQVANVLTMLSIVVVAPVVEEFAFRGLLLTRWSIKWGAPRAILLSSAIFGALHKEFLGHMFFGFVMCVLYIETKSLFVPILMHAANNTLAYGGALLGALDQGAPRMTMAAFQKQWGMVLTLSVIFIPLALEFIWRHFPRADWTMPYADFRKPGVETSPAADPLPFV